jgi:hypothetical protein
MSVISIDQKKIYNHNKTLYVLPIRISAGLYSYFVTRITGIYLKLTFYLN